MDVGLRAAVDELEPHALNVPVNVPVKITATITALITPLATKAHDDHLNS